MRFVLFAILSISALGQTFDTYGGWQQSPCTGGSSSHFYKEKVGSRWWLCTPSGNHLFFQGVGGAGQSANAVAKYGSTANWAEGQIAFVKSLNFNGIGELSDTNLYPTAATNTVPFMQTLLQSNYSTTNRDNLASRPIKNYMWSVNGYFNAYRGAGCIDAFDDQYLAYITAIYATDPIIGSYFTSPYFVAVFGDDTDFICLPSASTAYQTVLAGHQKAHMGYTTLVTSPKQTVNNGFTYAGTIVQYSDTPVYSKTAMASPPVTCSVTTPCSLRTFLAKRYGTIAALNAAWGSNYTTFDSAGIDVSGETCGTGNGVTLVFNCTLAHGNVSPFSVTVKVAGASKAGDCPWFTGSCSITGQAAPYTCASAGDCVGSLIGAAGTTVVNGYQPWQQVQQTSAADCGGCGLPQAKYWVRTAWHGANCPTVPSREIDSNFLTGAPQVTVITQNNSADNPPCATGVDIYVSCRVASGAATKGCAASGASQPIETLQASNVAYPGGSWTEPTSGLVAGAALPTPPSQIDYKAKTVQITFSAAPANGAAITLDYTYSGWMFGTGLMDEDGRNSAWVGTNAICLKAPLVNAPGNENYICNGTTSPVVDANATLGTDLDDWLVQGSARYFKDTRTAIKATAPNVLYCGTDTIGDWGVPDRKQVLQGAAPYLDCAFLQWFANQPDVSTANSMYQYMGQWLGDIPLLNFVTLHAQPDSAMAGNSNSDCCFGLATQSLRGQQWYTMNQSMLNTLGFNSSYQWVGTVWWGLGDFTNEGIDWGLKTPTDNAYNAHDAASGALACAAPLAAYTCGSEPAPSTPGVRPFGNLLTGITAANSLWYETSPQQFTGGKSRISGKVRK